MLVLTASVGILVVSFKRGKTFCFQNMDLKFISYRDYYFEEYQTSSCTPKPQQVFIKFEFALVPSSRLVDAYECFRSPVFQTLFL